MGPVRLGGVDKFKPVSGVCDMNHAHEVFGELIVTSGSRALIFKREHALDAVASLVEGAVVVDLCAAG